MSTKKTPSLASTLDAQEVKYRTPKSRKKERSIHEKELAEIAREIFYTQEKVCDWARCDSEIKYCWRSVVTAVLEEALYRVEKNLEGK